MRNAGRKALIIGAALALSGVGAGSAVATGATTIGVDSGSIVKNQQNKAVKNKVKVTRLTSSSRYVNRFLLPVTKQKFKQNQRKELTKSRKRKNKQF